MLKTKRFKAQFYGYGLLILSTPQTAFSQNIQPQFETVAQTVTAADTTKNVTDSSLVSVEKQKRVLLEAPKILLHPKAEDYVAKYLVRNNEDLVEIKKRSTTPFHIIESVLKKNNLPLELKYLAVIESELKSGAISHVGAVGPWQLMPQTAREFGLKTGKYDERKHFTKSTQAAAKYMKTLYAQFDDWLLVIAAYNSGAGPVYKAIKKSGSRDFWKLQHYLPAETRNHVKRFIGAHYYFENEGSETTLTKKERLQYLTAIADYEAGSPVISELTMAAPVSKTIENTISATELKIKEK